MWKDFFYYSKGERRAVWVLLTLIALFVMAIVLLPEYHSRKVLETQASDSIELRKFAAENQKNPRARCIVGCHRSGQAPCTVVISVPVETSAHMGTIPPTCSIP